MDSAVNRAIECMWHRYNEPLSLTDIACSAILSRFHFSRIFKSATGVSPCGFLSAVRIYQAKRMLLNTDLKVTDISFAVGYNSLGSFTNHFTASVGVSPGRFRRLSGRVAFESATTKVQRQPNVSVTGQINVPKDYAWTRVYLGAFEGPIVQCRPTATAIVELSPAEAPHPYVLSNVPCATRFIHAVAVADTVHPEPWTHRTLLVGTKRLGAQQPGSVLSADISLRIRRPTDLPILLALPDLEAELDTFEAGMAEIAVGVSRV